MSSITTLRCSACGLQFKPYWLKDGMCNGCRHPEAVVEAYTSSRNVLETGIIPTGTITFPAVENADDIQNLSAEQIDELTRRFNAFFKE